MVLIFLSFFFKMGDDSKHTDSTKFCNWAKKNCPRVFDGIHHWIARTLLSKGCLQRAAVKVGMQLDVMIVIFAGEIKMTTR